MKPKLLVIELWGLGDLAIATPFLRAAAEKFSVTMLAKPHALELRPRLWPEVSVVPFVAPWTAFRGKYKLLEWPWRELCSLRSRLAAEKFEFALSGRHDARDHLLMQTIGAERRLGFSHMGSAMFLTDALDRPKFPAHRYESWRVAGRAVGLELPSKDKIPPVISRPGCVVLVHSGARLPARVWPLERYRELVRRLREAKWPVQVACDSNQRDWWLQSGETAVVAPQSIAELFALIDRAAVFVGNCSGPGHIAAISGVPTFTLFGPSLPEWFAPLHPAAEWLDDRSCPYKPCADYCRFPTPRCLENLKEDEVWARVEKFAARHLSKSSA